MYDIDLEYRSNTTITITAENAAGLHIGDTFKGYYDEKTNLVTFRAYGCCRSLDVDLPFFEVKYGN